MLMMHGTVILGVVGATAASWSNVNAAQGIDLRPAWNSGEVHYIERSFIENEVCLHFGKLGKLPVAGPEEVLLPENTVPPERTQRVLKFQVPGGPFGPVEMSERGTAGEAFANRVQFRLSERWVDVPHPSGVSRGQGPFFRSLVIRNIWEGRPGVRPVRSDTSDFHGRTAEPDRRYHARHAAGTTRG